MYLKSAEAYESFEESWGVDPGILPAMGLWSARPPFTSAVRELSQEESNEYLAALIAVVPRFRRRGRRARHRPAA
jgi:hypothetical protein